jgi:hypothetical protein
MAAKVYYATSRGEYFPNECNLLNHQEKNFGEFEHSPAYSPAPLTKCGALALPELK